MLIAERGYPRDFSGVARDDDEIRRERLQQGVLTVRRQAGDILSDVRTSDHLTQR
jgi:hypothetical protein